MAMTMHVDVVSVEEALFSGLAEFVVAPAEMGEVCIYPMHAPMLTRLSAGIIRLKIPFQTQEMVIYVSRGILEVLQHGVTILADMAVRERDIEDGKLEEKNPAGRRLDPELCQCVGVCKDGGRVSTVSGPNEGHRALTERQEQLVRIVDRQAAIVCPSRRLPKNRR